MSFAEKTTPLWTCSRCGRRFLTANVWHACSQRELDEHFADKPANIRRLYEAWLAFVENNGGPTTVLPQKTRISFQAHRRFANMVIRKNWIECGLWLKHAATHPLFTRVQLETKHEFVYIFRLTEPSQLDKELAALVKEAYRGGLQDK
jgi:hypothetical protein